MPGKHQVKPFRTTPAGQVNQAKLLRMVRQEFETQQRADGRLRGMVGQARKHGVTWEALGEAMGGITRQLAQQRFGQ